MSCVSKCGMAGVARIGREAPNFTATAVLPDGSFKDISLEDYRGKYVVLFFYPLDFTFVCPSEILAFNAAVAEFEKRNTQLIGCSIDSAFTHAAWRRTPVEQGGIGEVAFPLVADVGHKIVKSYQLESEGAVAYRGLYLLDKAGVIRHITINDLPLGRNVEEAIRMVDALQFHEEHGEVCPANWKKGAKAMKPDAAGVADYLKTQYGK